MAWIESQIEQRRRLDAEKSERAYARLASSVTSAREAPVFRLDDLEHADSAARIALRYIGAEPGPVPEGVTDVDEYLEYLLAPSGVMRRRVRLEEGWHKYATGAMLARLDTGEPVALIPRKTHGYCFFRPDTGARVNVTARVARHIGDEALLLYRALPQRPLVARDLFAFMARVLDANDYVSVVLAALAATLVGLLPVWANGVAFGVVVPSGQVSLIAPIAALLLGVAASTIILGACRNLVMTRVSLKLGVACEAAVFSRLLSLPTSFFRKRASGDIATRAAQTRMLTQLLSNLTLGAGLTVALSLVYLVQVAFFAGELVGPAFLVVLAQAAATVLAGVVTARWERATMEANARVSGTVTALLAGVNKIKLAGAERRAFVRWADDYVDYARSAYNRPLIVRVAPSLSAFIGLLGTAGIYWFAGGAGMSVADYMSFNVAYGQMQAAILLLSSMVRQFSQVGPMVDLLRPILEATPETAEGRPAVESLSGAIEMSDVTFAYGPDQPTVLRKLNLRVEPGEYVAIVGKSGCGKSTIIRLLLGFEQPDRGTVLYGNYDVSKVDLRSLRRHIGTVMQDGRLIMGPIENNITVATPGATTDDAWRAAEIAGIADDIRRMPMGMRTIVSEGSGSISGGQRQRIMIARAACGSKRILLLDEATSALDNRTQRRVSDLLAQLDCTRIVVAHRLSTVRHCDRILVIDDGRVAEEGTFDELMEAGGLFADLVARQRLDE